MLFLFNMNPESVYDDINDEKVDYYYMYLLWLYH